MFKAEQQFINEALRVIARLSPPDSGNVTIQSNGKKVWLHSSNETSKASIQIPTQEVDGKGEVYAVSIQSLMQAVKGRKELELTFSKALCHIKSSGYKAELSTVDALELESADEKRDTVIDISAEQAQFLKAAASTVALKSNDLTNNYMPLAIKITKKGAFVCCYDNDHLAFVNSSEITGDLEMKMPLETMLSVLDCFAGAAFKMELGKSTMLISNKMNKVMMALPQSEEGELTVAEVLETARAANKAEGKPLVLEKQDLINFLDNSRSVATKERSELALQVEDGKCKIAVQTVQGSTKASLKTQAKKMQFKIDFEYFDEAVRKTGEQVEIKVVGDEFVAFKLAKSTIVVSMNQ